VALRSTPKACVSKGAAPLDAARSAAAEPIVTEDKADLYHNLEPE
jgi:hypothetical protein